MFDVKTFDVKKYDCILARGLSQGIGSPGAQMCIEAAICAALGLPHGDDPKCVANAVRSFKIGLNDAAWSSPAARAKGLRNLGLAQLGSLDVVKDKEFAQLLAEKFIRVLIPTLFREIFPENQKCLAALARCEAEGTADAATDATNFARAATAYYPILATYHALRAANYAIAVSANTIKAVYAADTASCAVHYAAAAASCATSDANDKYLLLAADLALDVLRDLRSPGISLL